MISPRALRVECLVKADSAHVWSCWTEAKHVMHWNFASDDWHCPKARNELKPGGSFSYTMAARDGSEQFDFEGVFDAIEPLTYLAFTLGDGRKVELQFEEVAEGTRVREDFEPENMNPIELQQAGWQAILDNFKRYAESSKPEANSR